MDLAKVVSTKAAYEWTQSEWTLGSGYATATTPRFHVVAFDYGVKFTGCTVHFVDQGVDSGPIIAQKVVPVFEKDTAASLHARVNEYTARFTTLKQQATMVPQVETDLVQLTRDYEVNKASYDQLLSRRGSAQMSEDMESKTDVIDFKVIDPPYVPPNSSFPNRPLLLSAVLLLALAGGAGVAFLISQIRPVIVDRTGISDITEYPVLGSVTMVWNNQQLKARRKKLITWMATLGSLVSAYAVLLGVSFLLSRGGI